MTFMIRSIRHVKRMLHNGTRAQHLSLSHPSLIQFLPLNVGYFISMSHSSSVSVNKKKSVVNKCLLLLPHAAETKMDYLAGIISGLQLIELLILRASILIKISHLEVSQCIFVVYTSRAHNQIRLVDLSPLWELREKKKGSCLSGFVRQHHEMSKHIKGSLKHPV